MPVIARYLQIHIDRSVCCRSAPSGTSQALERLLSERTAIVSTIGDAEDDWKSTQLLRMKYG